MEITLEQVEKLRARADLSYEEARALLERCGGSVLDALIELERQGRAESVEGTWRSDQAPPAPETHPAVKVETVTGSAWENFFKDAGCLLGRCWEVLRNCTRYRFQVDRGGRTLTALPLWVLLVLLVVAPKVAIPLLLLGLLFGCHYRLVREEDPRG